MARPPKAGPKAVQTGVSLYPHQRTTLTRLGGSAFLQGFIDAHLMKNVRAIYGGAFAEQIEDGSWIIRFPGKVLGHGPSAGAAWFDASEPKATARRRA